MNGEVLYTNWRYRQRLVVYTQRGSQKSIPKDVVQQQRKCRQLQ